MSEKRPSWSAPGRGYPLRSHGSSCRMSAPLPQGAAQPQQSRLQEVLGGIPLCTMVVTAVCVVLQAMVFLTGMDITTVAINAGKVLYGLEFYRMLTAPYFHAGILHILMNMLSFTSIGGWLESKCGTFYFTLTILWATILSNLIYVTVCWLLALYITGDYSWLSYTSIGFSGVIFTLAFIESHSSTVATHSVFGFCNVPSKLYPWVLLVLLQIMMPAISFLGHLSGLLVGVLQCYGVLRCFMPSAGFIQSLEQSAVLAPLVRNRKYVPCPEVIDLRGSDQGSALSHLWQVIVFVVQGVGYVLQAIWLSLRSLCTRTSSSLPVAQSGGGLPPHVRLPPEPGDNGSRRFDVESQQRLVL